MERVKRNHRRKSVYDLYRIINRYKGYLIHVTEFENIESIFRFKGIYSSDLLNRKGIKPVYMTGDISHRKDQEQKLDKYVHLAFDENFDLYSLKIFYDRLKNPAIIIIDPRIILHVEGVIFSDSYMDDDNAIIGDIEMVFDHMDFNAIYNTSWHTHRDEYHIAKRQAKVMIPDYIGLYYISEIIIPYDQSISYIRDGWVRRADTKKVLGFRSS